MSATANISAGLVLIRRAPSAQGRAEVLLGHPGGPFWAKRHEGAWTIPKGLLEPGESPLDAALREASEELGVPAPPPPHVELGEVRMKSGKRVLAWAAALDLDPSIVRSNEITIEWPPRSGKQLRIPEIDRAQWCSIDQARVLANPALVPLLERALAPDVQRVLFAP